MKIGILTVILVLTGIALPIVYAASEEPYIVIDDGANKVKFNKFSAGDPWSITIRDASTGELRYQFSGTIQSDGNQNPNVFIWFSEVSPGGLNNGVQKCLWTGSYTVHAEATHNGNTISEDCSITIEEESTCEPKIPPIPELGTIVLTSTGIIGILLISRKYRK